MKQKTQKELLLLLGLTRHQAVKKHGSDNLTYSLRTEWERREKATSLDADLLANELAPSIVDAVEAAINKVNQHEPISESIDFDSLAEVLTQFVLNSANENTQPSLIPIPEVPVLEELLSEVDRPVSEADKSVSKRISQKSISLDQQTYSIVHDAYESLDPWIDCNEAIEDPVSMCQIELHQTSKPDTGTGLTTTGNSSSSTNWHDIGYQLGSIATQATPVIVDAVIDATVNTVVDTAMYVGCSLVESLANKLLGKKKKKKKSGFSFTIKL
jgi:hypothetical protein